SERTIDLSFGCRRTLVESILACIGTTCALSDLLDLSNTTPKETVTNKHAAIDKCFADTLNLITGFFIELKCVLSFAGISAAGSKVSSASRAPLSVCFKIK